MRLPLTIVALLGLVPALSEAAAQDRVATEWGQVQFYRDRGITEGVIAGPADSAWTVLEALVKDAGIELTTLDRSQGQMTNPRFRAVHKLGKERLSKLFSCGQGLTGPNADIFHVYIGFGIAIAPVTPDRTRFQLVVQAEAVDIPGGRSERLPCSTTGLLELALVDRLNDVFPGTK